MEREYRTLKSSQIEALSPEEVVEHYKNYVYSIVNTIHKSLTLKIDIEDLESYGFLGLLEAHSRYKANSGSTFTTFAYYRIRGSIFDGCRKEGWIPHARKKRHGQLEKIHPSLENNCDSERASVQSFSDTTSRLSRVPNFAMIILMDETDIENFAGKVTLPQQELGVEKNELTTLLFFAMRCLTPEERDIIMRYHFYQEGMKDIGNVYGYTKSWVSRIRTRALEKMYHMIQSMGVDGFEPTPPPWSFFT